MVSHKMFLACIIWLSLLPGGLCAIVRGDTTIHLSAKIRTGSYNNTMATEFATKLRMSLMQCIETCNQTRSCRFVNYDRTLKTCHLIECDNCLLVQSVKQIGLCFWNKSEAAVTDDHACSSCTKYDKCNNTQDCEPQSCGAPKPRPYTIKSGNMHLTDNTLKYVCFNNLTQIGNKSYTTCQNDGSWTPLGLVCGYCGPPPTKLNELTVGGGNFTAGAAVTYGCKPNCTMIDPLSSVLNSTCQPDDTWSPVNITCLAHCEAPASQQDAYVANAHTNYLEGDMIYYECDVTFVMLEGNVSVSYCLQTGLWSKVAFQCAATCEAPVEIDNATIVGVNSTNKDGGMISYQCDTNFKMLPENNSTIIRSTSVCLSNSSWSAVSFQCVPMCSPPLYNYTDASPFGIQTPYVPGDTVYFICDPGFQMSPNNVSFTVCLDNGTWSAVNFQCVATCGRPPTFLNTHIIRTNMYANTVVAGDAIYYECNQNYSMLPGNTSTSICQSDSSWTAVNFQCAPSCNPPLTNYTNATAVGIKPAYVEGDMVYFVCHSDYIVSMNNVSTTVCQSDGTWSATNFHCVLRCIPRVPVNYIEETENGVLYFRFLAVFDLLTLTEAYTNCNELCGKLIQFDRYEKFEIVQNEFKADTGYDGEHYWIDAQFDSTVSEWKTVNGTIVESDSTQTTDMWKNGNAKDGSPPCACMNYVSHFQLYDIDCASTLRSVCERHPYY